MKLLVVGGGGREHALAWKLAQSPRVEQVYVAPGNGGTACEPKVANLALSDHAQLANFARDYAVRFTVVGPEAPLAAGLVDHFQARGLAIFGPTRKAAQLESSKDFAKHFMARAGIPTAQFRSFTDCEQAHEYLRTRGAPIVVKADGLAAGKGVVVAHCINEAHLAVESMLAKKSMGDAGRRVVVEDWLEGEEASFIAMLGGGQILALAAAQDHKRLLDHDQGPNTGGMGACSPAPAVSAAVHDFVMQEVMGRAVRQMALEQTPYTGFLYAGLMIDPKGDVRVLEFNCRLGDPEAQVILARLQTDLVDLIEAALASQLDRTAPRWDPRHAVGVVMASQGYPANAVTGALIEGLGSPGSGSDLGPASVSALEPVVEGPLVFHAATQCDQGQLRSSGGRVLCVVGLGTDVEQARLEAYRRVSSIHFAGAQFRRDIGTRPGFSSGGR
jgi:phosphoribosylamine--glycine ligase